MGDQPRIASIHTLPKFKDGESALERLQELENMAREHPERFARIIVVYEEANDKGQSKKTRWNTFGIADMTDVVGTMEFTKHKMIRYMNNEES